ncbi:MAG: glycosyltransferase family 4 protein [Nitrospira sp.]|nr:glycosyltransferase family 4 protein [Nitrospira sp.]
MKKGVLSICYFGTYSMEEGYPRNRVIIEGLRQNGVDVVECHEDFWKDTSQKLEGVKAGSGIVKMLYRLLLTYSKLIIKFRRVGHYDALIVGYAGHIDIFLAKVLNLFRRKPLIFDAFLSLYDTTVMDRRIVRPGSVKARLLRLIDTWSCRLADAVLLDTQAHVDYFVKEFGIPSGKFFAVPVGSALHYEFSNVIPSKEGIQSNGLVLDSCFRRNDDLRTRITDTIHEYFEILYFGSYIPLHGVDVIIMAAKILEDEKDIVFTMIGKGQLLPAMKQLASDLELKNVNFIDRFVEENELVQYIRRVDVCLGIFGNTEKALRVIPCKVYNCLQFGKPLITGHTVATEGILKHKENAFLCRPGDAEELAKGITELKDDVKLRENIGTNGYKYFESNFSVEAIGQGILKIIHKIL